VLGSLLGVTRRTDEVLSRVNTSNSRARWCVQQPVHVRSCTKLKEGHARGDWLHVRARFVRATGCTSQTIALSGAAGSSKMRASSSASSVFLPACTINEEPPLTKQNRWESARARPRDAGHRDQKLPAKLINAHTSSQEPGQPRSALAAGEEVVNLAAPAFSNQLLSRLQTGNGARVHEQIRLRQNKTPSLASR